RLEQIFLPPPCCALVRPPGSDHKMSAAAQKTPCFADQPGLERNVLGAFNGDYGIEAFCRQVVLQRIDQYKIELLIAVRRGFGMVELFRRDRKSGDFGTIVTVQHPRAATIATAHIANPIAGSNGGFLRYQAGEISDG